MTSLRRDFPAFQVAERQLTIESGGDCQIPGSDFELEMAQLRHHDRRIHRSRHGNEPTSFKPTGFTPLFIAPTGQPVEYQQYRQRTLHTSSFTGPEGARNSQAMLNSIRILWCCFRRPIP
ncbi:hypothetical protein BPOR_0197g00120 [Botrytis porri]|uniref:Uncharacterized protein n=1 Tax=Botrytis porri TaxID=87229 RepID=A0A4Z1KTQ2_9HELO|nr:hypothetical protein BPOR_0197g00120 [Botrytis porri]